MDVDIHTLLLLIFPPHTVGVLPSLLDSAFAKALLAVLDCIDDKVKPKAVGYLQKFDAV